MAITTYAELKTAIANWLNRDDLTSVIPDFITLTEAQLNRSIRHWRMEKRVETTLDEQYENLPSDFMETLELTLTDGDMLTLISTADMQRRKRDSVTTGKPRFYRVSSDQFEFYPAPDGSYTLSLQYYGKTPALSDSNTSNWMLEYAPDLYLYGSLLQAAPYLGEDQRLQVWGNLYTAALQEIQQENMTAKYSGPLKMGVPK